MVGGEQRTSVCLWGEVVVLGVACWTVFVVVGVSSR